MSKLTLFLFILLCPAVDAGQAPLSYFTEFWRLNTGTGTENRGSINNENLAMYRMSWVSGKYGYGTYGSGYNYGGTYGSMKAIGYAGSPLQVTDTGAFTYSAWMKADHNYFYPNMASMNSPTSFFQLRMKDNNSTIETYILSSSVDVPLPAGANIYEWFHFVFTYNNKVVNFYFNGARFGGYTATGSASVSANEALCISSYGCDGTATNWKGWTDEVGFNNVRALSSAEIRHLYDEGESRHAVTRH